MHSNSGGVVVKEIIIFFSSPPSPAHPFYGLYLCWHSSSPSHFPSDLIPLSFPPRELMTRLKHEPNQGQALIRWQNASPLLDPNVDWRPPHRVEFKNEPALNGFVAAVIGRNTFSRALCLSLRLMNHKCQLWLRSKMLMIDPFLLSVMDPHTQPPSFFFFGSSWHAWVPEIQFISVMAPL